MSFMVNNRFLIIPTRIYINLRCIQTKNETFKVHHTNLVTVTFLNNILGLSAKKSNDLLLNNQELLKLSQKDVFNTTETLKSMNYNLIEIRKHPKILQFNSITLLNRHTALTECGCQPITLATLYKYIAVMNQNIDKLKSFGIIPMERNVQETLQTFFKNEFHIELETNINENTTKLKTVREIILNLYLKKKLNMKDDDLIKQWKVYSRIRHRSYQSITRMINILLNELNLPKDRIIKNGYAIYGDPDNVLKMLENIPKIGNEDFKSILYRRPKILMSNYESILKTIEHIKAFDIPESAINKCLEILTLGSDTVLERLEDLKVIEEFQVLTTNPRILRLVHYQTKARVRLDYLNQMKVKCASLHILSCGSNAFAKFARDGSDRTKGRDVVVYLANIFNKSDIEIRNFLSRHPNWCHIPVVQVKQCLEALLKKKFKLPDIYANIYILLYPIIRIEEKLQYMANPKTFKELALQTSYYEISNKLLLTLCLYLIEYEYHFLGDGIWTEHHTQHVENFNNLLPDFPAKSEKDYKYGTKPKNIMVNNT